MSFGFDCCCDNVCCGCLAKEWDTNLGSYLQDGVCSTCQKLSGDVTLKTNYNGFGSINPQCSWIAFTGTAISPYDWPCGDNNRADVVCGNSNAVYVNGWGSTAVLDILDERFINGYTLYGIRYIPTGTGFTTEADTSVQIPLEKCSILVRLITGQAQTFSINVYNGYQYLDYTYYSNNSTLNTNQINQPITLHKIYHSSNGGFGTMDCYDANGTVVNSLGSPCSGVNPPSQLIVTPIF